MTCPSCGADNEPAAEVCFSCRAVLAAVSRGTVLASRYEIRDLLGRGGMGTVYRAHDRVLDEDVAIKVLRPDLAAAPGMAERFLSEIKLARRVSHRNVCRIHEYGEEGRQRFISMELVDGKSLKDVLQKGPLHPAQAYDAAEQAARGLVAIHDVGIVHRDLKPANLTRDASGRVRVMDFGIAKAAGLPGDTTAGYLLGSPEYMSPEQARGRGADFRSDLYALGVVAFELFTGAPPFRGETPVATLLLHIEAPLPLDAPGLPAPFVPVLRRALAKDARERQGSARELADELRAAASGGAVGAPLLVSGTGPATSREPHRARVFVLGGVAVAFCALALALREPRSESREPRSLTSLGSTATPTPPQSVLPSAPPSPAPASDRIPKVVAGKGIPLPTVARSPASGKPLATPSPAISPPVSDTARDDSARVGERSAPPSSSPDPNPVPAAPAAAPSGFLLVVVSPWADVTVDGEPAGQTPLSRLSLAPGPHTVRLTNPDFQPYPRKVVVRSGETTRLAVDLAQDGVRARP